MRRALTCLTLVTASFFLVSCEGRTDKTDGGGVLLSITSAESTFIVASMSSIALTGFDSEDCIGGGFLCVGNLQIANIVKPVANSQNAGTSSLQTVELDSYEVTFTRGDSGTRLPAPLVRKEFLSIAPGGTGTIERVMIFEHEQVENEPLTDLLLDNGGRDRETDEEFIILNVSIRFFGRTLSGDRVESAPALFTLRVTP